MYSVCERCIESMKRDICLALCSTFAFAIPASGLSVVWNNNITNQDVLNFGASAHFQGIGQISGYFSGEEGFGTGTFIGFGNGYAWGLTANHVTDGISNPSFGFADGRNYKIDQTYHIAQDVTIFRMATFASGVYTPTLTTTGAFTIGQDVESAGYGLYGPQGTPDNRLGFDNLRRGWQSRISFSGRVSFGSLTIDSINTTFNAPGTPNARPLEGLTQEGDSGSPLLDDNGTVLGVLTGGEQGDSYGAESYFCALSPSIVSQIDSISGINPVPEPASFAAFGLGLLIFVRRRRS